MNRIHIRVLVSLLLLPLTACVTHREEFLVGSSDYVLGQREFEDGGTETYRLRMGSGGRASLDVVTEYDKRRPFLGFQLKEIDKQLAQERGLEPYSGLLVEGVYRDSAAQRAGIVTGDILYALDARETIYRVHVADFEAGLELDKQVMARVGRGGRQLELPMRAQPLDERVSNTESVALESSSSRRPYAGVHLRGIPPTWCEKIYGERRNAVVISEVAVGSPAWLAGLRGGDVIDEVDGRPVPPLAELKRTIAERGAVGEPLRVGVSRAGSPSYETQIDLHDYSGETNVWFPLLFHYKNGVYRDRWGIGPWGLIMSNRNTYVADSTTRSVETRNVFHALLGLIKVSTGPDETRVRLLWFIGFDT
ncbi:MAG: PDZ domain-containing protein [bacterium]|nr:PDZ domain-containing protein [bacterium]